MITLRQDWDSPVMRLFQAMVLLAPFGLVDAANVRRDAFSEEYVSRDGSRRVIFYRRTELSDGYFGPQERPTASVR